MIQDIYPSKLNNEFTDYDIKEGDALMIFDNEGRIYVGKDEVTPIFPTYKSNKSENNNHNKCSKKDKQFVYLFSLDEKKYFLDLDFEENNFDKNQEGFSYYTIREARDTFSGKEVFAIFTAYHLWRWYSDNRYCGKCSEELIHDDKERALRCTKCGNMIFPRINPAVIIGVTNGDSILITRYRRGYAHNALVAGFTEIGETLEETVAREVMEEAGIKVKNIRYYKSQPWGMAQDLLAGFYCEVDGDSHIHMDENELKYAQWVKKEDIVLQPNNLSLTNEMMRKFKES
ncbi:MAG: NAD(+) diphosphatase [Lachnospiraceae bacterium]|nr:NAD(+) diphosphatase [Lachnospiraceae bacterium]